ncbi:MAG: hypothetical protein V3V20_01215 [Algisphaera sp.]
MRTMFILPPPSPPPAPQPTHSPRLRVAALMVCFMPLLGISAASAALLLGASSPSWMGWVVVATLLVGHAILTWLVAHQAKNSPYSP